MTMVTLVLTFMINSNKIGTLVHTFPNMAECQQEMNERIAEFDNMVLTAECN